MLVATYFVMYKWLYYVLFLHECVFPSCSCCSSLLDFSRKSNKIVTNWLIALSVEWCEDLWQAMRDQKLAFEMVANANKKQVSCIVIDIFLLQIHIVSSKYQLTCDSAIWYFIAYFNRAFFRCT